MPRTTKGRRKKTVKRAPRKAIIPIGVGNWPRQRIVNLRYVTSYTQQCSTGTLAALRFRANGIYDPDYSAGGHQPFGFDQMAQFYNHMEVQSSKIRVRAVNGPYSASYDHAMTGIYLADDATTAYNWTTFSESGRGSHSLMALANTENHNLSSSYSLKKFFTKKLDNSSTVLTDPTEQAYYVLWLQSADMATSTAIITYEITIDYKVKFYEPKDIVAS